jgi:SAM-dependent methyltransferase
MTFASRLSCALALGLALALPLKMGNAHAQTSGTFEPQVGQAGKDVIWVPTPQALIDQMMRMAKVTPQDYVVDLGSGDGRTVITAAKIGAKTLGVEYNPDMVELSKRNAAKDGIGEKARFIKGDIFETDFSDATVVTMFLLPSLNLKLRPKLLEMKPGTRLVSNTFNMGDWRPDETANVEQDCPTYCRALMWIVPAKAEGKWQLGQGELTLVQEFQFIRGTLTAGNTETPIADGKLMGDQISFKVAGTTYAGWVKGNSMEGTARTGGADSKWQASKK